jgi:hypothetical protein
MKKIWREFMYATNLIALAAVGCAGGSKSANNIGPGTFALAVTSVNPVSGLALKVTPADMDNAGGSGLPAPTTSLSLIYNAGTKVTLTAPAANSVSSPFVAWVGCDSATGPVCTVTMSASKSLQVEYVGVSSININPATITVAAGGGVHIPATVNGFGNCSAPTFPTQPCAGSPVTYSLYLPSGVTGSLGAVDETTGYYTPASSSPASSVMVTVQSALAPSVSATGLIELQQ